MTLARKLADRSTAVVAAVLAAVGLAVGVGLDVEGRRALDAALLAAAQARAQVEGDRQSGFASESIPVGVRLRVVSPDDPGAALVKDTEEPRYATVDGRRYLWLPVERELDGTAEREEDEIHAVVVADAPAPAVAQLVGPFLVLYALSASTAILATWSALRGVATAGLAPLQTARRDAARAVAAGTGASVPIGGPVEVRELLEAVNALIERRDAAFGAQSRFTAHAAHELRSPLAALRGELDVALRKPRSAEQWEGIARGLAGDAERLGAVVEGLLALARVEAGQTESGREVVRPGELLADAVRSEEAALKAAGCDLTVAIDDDRPVTVHRALAVVALANLLRNAAVHAPGGPVVVRTRADGGMVRFTVRDSGPGIAPDQRNTAFDLFVRGSGDGLGLGLPLARQIAVRHGGACGAGPGSEIWWCVPADGWLTEAKAGPVEPPR